MKVIAIMDFITSPICTVRGNIKFGETYTVKNKHYGYSSFFKRWIHAYEFHETVGYYEKGIFIPLSNIDETEMNLCELPNRITNRTSE